MRSRVMPALLTRMSSLPNWSTACFMSASVCARSATEPTWMAAAPLRISSQAARASCGRRLVDVVDDDLGAFANERERARRGRCRGPRR